MLPAEQIPAAAFFLTGIVFIEYGRIHGQTLSDAITERLAR